MKRIPKKKIHLFFTKAHIIGYNLNKYYLCNVICMHESAYTRLYNALNRSSCESHLALKIIMRTTDQWKKKKKKRTQRREKKRGERDDIRIKEERTRRFTSDFGRHTLRHLSVRATRRVALLSIMIFEKLLADGRQMSTILSWL